MDANEIHISGLKRMDVVVEIYSFETSFGLESTISCVHTDYSPFKLMTALIISESKPLFGFVFVYLQTFLFKY